ncbi:50S ribosomal protein L5 [Patescibacteria group bacterium]|nr:50S ribosomal protein L5 [Patescibacteria group bacterium]MBU1457698.1 50S ribosomal protein L5 [Patescibacteria group bacterium]
MKSDLKKKYQEVIRPALKKELGLSSVEAVPKITKITINTSSRDFKNDKDLLKKTKEWMSAISGQVPIETKAKLSVASFDLREGDIVGLKITLRGNLMYDFFQKLVNVVMPRLKDFQGVSRKKIDNQGNYTLGLTEQIIFPEVDYDKISKVQGLEISITTSTKDPTKALALLEALGMPFEKEEKK